MPAEGALGIEVDAYVDSKALASWQV